MNCPVCGSAYIIGGGNSHQRCYEIQKQRGEVDAAVAWVMSDDPAKGPMPELVKRLRAEILAEPKVRATEEEK